LARRRAFGSPTTDLLGVDVHEFELLVVNPLDPVDGGVIQQMGPGSRLGQRFDVIACVVQRTVDHAGDEGHLADWLPVHWVCVRHEGTPWLMP
jgi:hypothetical protein